MYNPLFTIYLGSLPDKRTPGTETPQRETLGQKPIDRDPLDRDLPVNRQTRAKIVPYPKLLFPAVIKLFTGKDPG